MKKHVLIDISLFIIFLVLIVLIKTNVVGEFDLFIYNNIASLINPTMTTFFKVFTNFGDTLFMVLITLGLFIILDPHKRGKDFALLMIITTIINNLVKIIIQRARPTILPLVIEKSYSFPSGHTMAAITLASFLIYMIWNEWGTLTKFWQIFLSILLGLYALLIIFSRIYLGAHFASDCLGAIILSNLILHCYLTYFKPKI